MNDKTLDREIENVEKDLNEPIPDTPTPKPEKTKMATKKVTKVGAKPTAKALIKANGKAAPAKTTNKAPAKKAAADVEGMVKLSTLAGEAKISTQRARQKLRAAELDRGDGRWSWKEGSRDLAAARKALGI